MNTLTKFSCLILIFICSCPADSASVGGWQMVFQNDANGQATFGDKSKLMDSVRLGYSVRIGWEVTALSMQRTWVFNDFSRRRSFCANQHHYWTRTQN